jgi:hypothetical protein
MRYPLNYMVIIVGYAYKRLNVISRQYDCISIYGLPVELHGQTRRLCIQSGHERWHYVLMFVVSLLTVMIMCQLEICKQLTCSFKFLGWVGVQWLRKDSLVTLIAAERSSGSVVIYLILNS